MKAMVPPQRFRAARELKRRRAESISRYQDDPVRYAREVLGVELWGRQQEVCRALLRPPHRVMVKSANSVGKTLLSACLACWFHDVFDPGIGIITGPKYQQLKDTTFKEIRRFFGSRPGMYPKNPRIETSPTHYVNGTTANDGTAFQGIHGDNLFLLFEEATGVEADFWTAARGIMAGGENTYHLAILNPTDSASQAYVEEQSGAWHVLSISAFEHPNVLAELQGQPALIPAAVRLEQLRDNMGVWGEFIPEFDAAPPRDIDLMDPATYGLDALPSEAIAGIEDRFPSRWWRPDALGDARICGRYPSQSAYSIFSVEDFRRACLPPPPPEPDHESTR